MPRFSPLLTPILALALAGCPAVPSADDDDAGDDDVSGDDDTTAGDDDTGEDIRVPAEWEDHGATWLQWPTQWEASARPAFADIVDVVQDYEPVHLLTGSEAERTQAQQFLADRGVPDTGISWHIITVDSSWMRDNGPVYVSHGGELRVLNFKFDAWGGNFGRGIPWQNDNAVPGQVAEILGLPCDDHLDYVLERGNLEFNGAGTLVLNWDCQDDRNPGLTEAEHEQILVEAFGLDRVIWAHGHHPQDGTTGHIDGTARFIDEHTIAIAESSWGAETEDALVEACEAAGLDVVRIPCPGQTDYMNWLVGNGYVAAMTFDNPGADAAAQAQLESLFPGRDVHLIDASTLWAAGGGVHCVTNDQPALP